MRRVFRSRRGWASFLDGPAAGARRAHPRGGLAARRSTWSRPRTLYQTLYWVARTAAEPTPATDVLHVTAAGWSAIPALVHKALHGTPMVLTEHGVYVREAYLAAVRGGGVRRAAASSPTRLARGLARAAYAGADVVSPVTDANAFWEEGLGIDPDKIHVLYNGLQPAADRRRRRPATRSSSRSGGSTRSRTSTRCCGSREETLRHVPDAHVPALRAR